MWGDLSLHLGDGDGDLALGLDLRLVGSLWWGGDGVRVFRPGDRDCDGEGIVIYLGIGWEMEFEFSSWEIERGPGGGEFVGIGWEMESGSLL